MLHLRNHTPPIGGTCDHAIWGMSLTDSGFPRKMRLLSRARGRSESMGEYVILLSAASHAARAFRDFRDCALHGVSAGASSLIGKQRLRHVGVPVAERGM